MRAWVIDRLVDLGEGSEPLSRADLPDPEPGRGEVRVAVSVCGVCHTELDEIEGRTAPPELPVVPGHQVVGTIDRVGADVEGRREGERVGVAWIWRACGECRACSAGEENLCPDFVATGRDVHGGYAERMLVPAGFALPVPEGLSDRAAAPLLCAGAIGYRSLRLAGVGDGGRLGLTGFGASAHLVARLVRAVQPETEIFVFARSASQRDFAREIGAAWAGATEERAPRPLDAVIDTTPAWKPVVEALPNLRPGGRLVINAIRKEAGDREELLSLDYAEDLWMEREIKSVANVTRRDVAAMLALAAEHGVEPTVEEHPFAEANEALMAVRAGGSRGGKVLRVGSSGRPASVPRPTSRQESP